MKTFKKDKLTVEIYENRTLMGEAAAKDIKAKIAELLAGKQEINMIFAAAPSQNDVLKSLVEDKEIEWRGFQGYEFEFEGLQAKLIKPNCKPNGKWLLKAEYFDAFPETEIELLNRGWHLAYNQNHNRWAEDLDLERKSKFLEYIPETFGLSKKCVLVGMSCGGLYSVKLTALNPERIQGIYLDAPVMNLLSCPGNLGKGNGVPFEEYMHFTGRTLVEMLSYREHPIDKMHVLAEHKIPIVMVAGDSDSVVPYDENGALLEKYYKQCGLPIDVFVKKGAEHHPHGLENPCIVADIIEKF